MTERPRAATCLIIFLAAGLTLGACEEDVAAPSGVEEPFSLYGIINPRRSAQSMLVSPIQPLLSDFSGPIDATVRSTDLVSGDVVTWNDSVVTGGAGERFYVFVADYRAQFGRAYRVEVSRSDGAASWAEARVPGKVSITTSDRAGVPGPFPMRRSMEVHVIGNDFHLLTADVVYTLRWQPSPGKGEVCQLPIDSYPVPYIDDVSEVDGGYTFVVDLSSDVITVEAAYRADYASGAPCDSVIPEDPPDDPKNAYPLCFQPGRNGPALMDMELQLLVAQPEWNPPGGSFDESALSDPRVMTNVINGLGFVAGGYNEDVRLFPSKDVVDHSHFFDYLQRPPGICRDYCTCGNGP